MEAQMDSSTEGPRLQRPRAVALDQGSLLAPDDFARGNRAGLGGGSGEVSYGLAQKGRGRKRRLYASRRKLD